MLVPVTIAGIELDVHVTLWEDGEFDVQKIKVSQLINAEVKFHHKSPDLDKLEKLTAEEVAVIYAKWVSEGRKQDAGVSFYSTFSENLTA